MKKILFFKKALIAIIALGILTGCVFLRLSRVLVQMKEPSRYLVVSSSNNFYEAKLVRPVFYISDIEYLLGKKLNYNRNKGNYYLEYSKKDLKDRKPWRILFWEDKHKKMIQFRLPNKLTEVIGNEIIQRGIAAVGHAEVSISNRTVYMKMKANITLEQTISLMGEPVKKIKSKYHFDFYSDNTFFNAVISYKNQFVNHVHISANGYYLDLKIEKE